MAIIGTNDTATVRVASLPIGAAFDNAANVTFSATGGISATNVQAAIAELDTEKQNASLARGTATRPLIQILRDTPPSVADFGAVGDGTTNDATAIQTCLNTYGVAHVPYFQPGTYTPAVWSFSQVNLVDGQQLIGDPRKPMLKQRAGDNLIVMFGDNNRLENFFIDQSATTVRDLAESTIVLDSASGPMQHNRIKHIIAGIDRDYLALKNGYDFIVDTPHVSNKIVDLQIEDVQVFGALGLPYYFTQLFASIYFNNVICDWTRQAAAPVYSAFDITGGEGIFLNECAAQGVGTGGTGNALSHAYKFTNGRAIRLTDCYGDTVGGSGLKATGTDGLTIHGHRSSLCGEHQYDINAVTNLAMVEPYAGGRKGISGGWSPTNKAGILLTGVSNASISTPNVRTNTGSGIVLASSNLNQISGGQIFNNGDYGVEETGTSNFNGVSATTLNVHATANGIFTGTGSYLNGIQRASGVPLGFSVPGAATW